MEKESGIELTQKRIKEILLGAGLSEIITYSIVPNNSLEIISSGDIFKDKVILDNPLSEENSLLKNNMVYSLINTAKENIRRQNYDFGLFEAGKIFYREEENVIEKIVIAGILCGKALSDLYEKNNKDISNYDFYYVKGLFEKILDKLLIKDVNFKEVEMPCLQPGKKAKVIKDNEILGVFGEVNSKVKQNIDISNALYYFEIDLEKAAMLSLPKMMYEKISKYPSSKRDVSLLIDEKISYDEIMNVINSAGSKILKDIELFDKYKGENIQKGKISLAFHLTYQSDDKTLTEEEINGEHDRLKALLVKKLKADIR